MLLRLKAWIAKWSVILVLGLLVLAIVVALLGYNSWRNSRNAKNTIQAVRTVGQAGTAGGQAAVNTLQGNQQNDQDTDAKTRPIIQNFNSYPAAKTEVDPALFDAFNRAICMYKSSADLPECRAMREADTKSVEGEGR